ncbi:50S ribosomal protein L32 [Citrus sinensis]|uniref:50S ribosomal protein L32 n=1 Tax=Citrus sinensis TaxID=2711 RepID=A0ACB8JR67_CITSI|nr:50S ribosomal protein L32 [Citrus sinensis]
MALRSAMLKSSDGTTGWMLPFRKWVHAFTLPLLFPNFSFGGSMELMVVLKNREFFILNVSCHKSGIRNGLKSLKSVPIIVRCNCGQVNLPYFTRCSTDRKVTSKIIKLLILSNRILSHGCVKGVI